MSDETPPTPPPPSPKKPKEKTKPGAYAKPMTFRSLEARVAFEKNAREERIEQIAMIMRTVSNKAGKMSWTPKVRRTLAAQWGMEDKAVRALSAVASKRVLAEIFAGEGMWRHASSAFMDAVAHAHAKKDWKTIAALMAQAINAMKLMKEKPEEKAPEVTHEAARAAVAKRFPGNAAKTDDSLATATLEPSADEGAASSGCAPGAGGPPDP